MGTENRFNKQSLVNFGTIHINMAIYIEIRIPLSKDITYADNDILTIEVIDTEMFEAVK